MGRRVFVPYLGPRAPADRMRSQASGYARSAASGIPAKMGNLQLWPGSLFANRFEIQRAAGSGGMGTAMPE